MGAHTGRTLCRHAVSGEQLDQPGYVCPGKILPAPPVIMQNSRFAKAPESKKKQHEQKALEL
jgi:hypothetical protein